MINTILKGMYKLRSEETDLFRYKFICELENDERSVEVFCKDDVGNYYNVRRVRPTLNPQITISRIDVKKQGKNILNEGVVVAIDEGKKTKFKHVKSVSFEGKEKYKTFSYRGEQKTFTDKYLPFLSSDTKVHVSLHDEYEIEQNPVGQFV